MSYYQRAKAETKTFLKSGGSVCPFAKTSPLTIVCSTDDMQQHFIRFKLGQSIIILPSGRLDLFSSIDYWAKRTFLCCVGDAIKATPGLAMDSLQIMNHLDKVTSDVLNDASPHQHYITLREEPLLTVCMAPIYPKDHPRWAPHPMLVLTWLKDINEVGPIEKIRKAMGSTHGHAYDAKLLMLPVPE